MSVSENKSEAARLWIPGTDRSNLIQFVEGEAVHFVGANGSGKSRLAVYIEDRLGEVAHRVSAHRALGLNPGVAKVGESAARSTLRYGHPTLKDRQRRWSHSLQGAPLNDFDALLQTLFAEQSNTALRTHQTARSGESATPEATLMEALVEAWHSILPLRRLAVSGDDIQVSADMTQDRGDEEGGSGESLVDVDSANQSVNEYYSASDLSDGERAVFYLLGQSLCAPPNTVLIFDEPELHIHRSIMGALFDRIEADRPDCCFVYVSHDLEFASSRVGRKLLVHEYTHESQWEIEDVPEVEGLEEEVVALILGSRRPILFVEGEATSLDLAVYRNVYDEWTVVPSGSCEAVIHAVTSLRRNDRFTRVHCRGIVDADDRHVDELERLREIGIHPLPVSEIESVFVLPPVALAIARHEGYEASQADGVLSDLTQKIVDHIRACGTVDRAVMQFCRRRIDSHLKSVDMTSASSVEDLRIALDQAVASLDVSAIAAQRRSEIDEALDQGDLTQILSFVDGKGLLAITASVLKSCKKDAFLQWLTRCLGSGEPAGVVEAVRGALPVIELPEMSGIKRVSNE